MAFASLKVGAVKHHLSAITAHRFYFDRIRTLRHDNHGPYPELLGGKGHRLAVVTG